MGILQYYPRAYGNWIIIAMILFVAGIGAGKLTQFLLAVHWVGKDAEPFIMGACFFGILIAGWLLVSRLYESL